MLRSSSDNSLTSVIEAAVSPVLARLSREIAKAIEAAGRRRGAAPAGARRRRLGKRSRRRVEMAKWLADRNARRVPTFVIEATGLDTKKAIVAKYGADAAFEKGKPLPKEVAGAQVRRTAGTEARTAKAKPPIVRKAAAAAK